jgi:hypothetical protein
MEEEKEEQEEKADSLSVYAIDFSFHIKIKIF